MYEQKTISETVDLLKCDIDQGLGPDEIESRAGFSGPNEIRPKEETPISSRIYDYLLRPFTLAMVLAALCLGLYSEFFAAALLLLANALEIFLSLKAEKRTRSALDTFAEFAQERVSVRREGETVEIAAFELVSGDVVLLSPGVNVPADLRLIHSSSLFIDESPLTGRPVLSSKDALFISDTELPLSKRYNMAYMGSKVMVGEGEGLVVSTGCNTEMGQAAYDLEAQSRPASPFETLLKRLSLPLAAFAGTAAALGVAAGLISKLPVLDSLFYGLNGLISAYPEGIGFVMVSAISLGAAGISRAGIILNRADSIPSLGSLTALCVDKTGTLTDNRIKVGSVYYNDSFFEPPGIDFASCGPLITGFSLCSSLDDEGDAAARGRFESALLKMTEDAGVPLSRIELAFPRISGLPFKPGHQMSTSLHEGPGGENVSFIMGPPEELISRSVDILKDGQIKTLSDEDMVDIEAAVQKMSRNGYDIITLCTRRGDRFPTEDNLVFVGLAGLSDPLCEGALEMVQSLEEAGIRIILFSEDDRARSIISARGLGLVEDELDQVLSAREVEEMDTAQLIGLSRDVSLYTGVTPSIRLKIIDALKASGETVGVTARGIWDCPALISANLGVALSDSGPTVRRAADVIMRERGLQNLANAASRAKAIFANTKVSLRYLLSANIALALVLLFWLFTGAEPPVSPFSILWLNLIALLVPAAALGGRPLSKSEAVREKNDLTGLLNRDFLLSSVMYGLFICFGAVLAGRMGLSIAEGSALTGEDALAAMRAFTFGALSFSMLLHIPGTIAGSRSIFTVNIFASKLAVLSMLLMGIGQGLILTVVPIASFFGLRPLSGSEWVMVLTVSLIPLLLHELVLLLNRMVGKMGK